MSSLNIAKSMAPEQNVPETVLKVCTNCGKSFDDEIQFLGNYIISTFMKYEF